MKKVYEIYYTECPAKLFTLGYLLFCRLLVMQNAKVRTFLKNWEICYMIGTRILKFDLEIAEIIEIKVATFNMEIIFLPL